MRQAGNPSSVDRLRMREMLVFKRTIPGKSPARRIAAERCAQAEKNRAEMKIKKSKETFFSLTYLATGDETDGKFFLSETIIPAGDNGPPTHIHSKEDEGFYLKKGNLTFIIDGKEIELKEGEYLNIEKGEKHTWRNKTEFDAELLVTFVPAGIENMFRELEQNMSDIKRIGLKYGTDFQID